MGVLFGVLFVRGRRAWPFVIAHLLLDVAAALGVPVVPRSTAGLLSRLPGGPWAGVASPHRHRSEGAPALDERHRVPAGARHAFLVLPPPDAARPRETARAHGIRVDELVRTEVVSPARGPSLMVVPNDAPRPRSRPEGAAAIRRRGPRRTPRSARSRPAANVGAVPPLALRDGAHVRRPGHRRPAAARCSPPAARTRRGHAAASSCAATPTWSRRSPARARSRAGARPVAPADPLATSRSRPVHLSDPPPGGPADVGLTGVTGGRGVTCVPTTSPALLAVLAHDELDRQPVGVGVGPPSTSDRARHVASGNSRSQVGAGSDPARRVVGRDATVPPYARADRGSAVRGVGRPPDRRSPPCGARDDVVGHRHSDPPVLVLSRGSLWGARDGGSCGAAATGGGPSSTGSSSVAVARSITRVAAAAAPTRSASRPRPGPAGSDAPPRTSRRRLELELDVDGRARPSGSGRNATSGARGSTMPAHDERRRRRRGRRRTPSPTGRRRARRS